MVASGHPFASAVEKVASELAPAAHAPHDLFRWNRASAAVDPPGDAPGGLQLVLEAFDVTMPSRPQPGEKPGKDSEFHGLFHPSPNRSRSDGPANSPRSE